MDTNTSANVAVTSCGGNVNTINEILGKLSNAKKDYDLKLAEIYISIAKVLFGDKDNIELQKVYYKRIYENNYISKVDLDAAKQLIKIKGIEKYLDLGWQKLFRIRECSKKTEDLNFLVAEEKYGDLHDTIKMETYLIKRLLATKSIMINDDILLKYVANGLRFEHFTENGLTELSKSKNKTRTLFKIRHNGITSDTEQIIKKSKISKNDQTKLLQLNARVRDIINNNERYKHIDESIVHDLAFNIYNLLDMIQKHYNGEYPYGIAYENENEEINKMIDDILNNYFIKVDGEYILNLEKK